MADERPPKRARREDVAYAFKALCPDDLVAVLIGKGGETRKQIEEETGAIVRMSGRDEFFPGTRCRILTITADDRDKLQEMLHRIIDYLIQIAGEEEQKGGRKGKGKDGEIGLSLLGMESGEFVFRLSLPHVCTGNLIGPRGERKKRLQEESGCKVFVENETHNENQMVRVIGNPEAIFEALIQVLDIIEEEVPQDRLGQWASSPMEAIFLDDRKSSKGKGKGKDDEGKGKKGKKGRDRERSRERMDERDRGGRSSQEWEESYDQQGYSSPPRDGPAGDHSTEASVEAIRMLIDEFPKDMLDVDYQVNCELPDERVGGLIGRKGEHIKSVENSTGTKIAFAEAVDQPGDSQVCRTMSISGPLISVYAAHMMMMKKYHLGDERQEKPGRGDDAATVDALQAQLAELQSKLQDIEGGGGRQGSGGGKSRKGGGKARR